MPKTKSPSALLMVKELRPYRPLFTKKPPEPRHDEPVCGNGAGFSVREVVEVGRCVTGSPIGAVEAPRRVADPPVLVASSEKIRQDLGWRPEKPSLEAMISDAWARGCGTTRVGVRKGIGELGKKAVGACKEDSGHRRSFS